MLLLLQDHRGVLKLVLPPYRPSGIAPHALDLRLIASLQPTLALSK